MQFSLQTLMLSFVVVAAAVGLCGPWGVLLAAVILACAGYIRMAKSRPGAWLKVVFFWGFCSCAGILSPLFIESRVSPQRACCSNNQSEIALALLGYENKHGHFPPAYIADANGKLMHSWRVLILPQLGRNDLYSDYDFNEPWNGPHNSKLAAAMPMLFSCPNNSNLANQNCTNYVAVVGARTMWPGAKTSSIKDVADGDGTSETIAFMEFPNSDINWLEPRDISFEVICEKMTPENRAELFNAHQGISMVSFVDGHYNVFSDRFLEKNIRAMLTINGGEMIDWEHDPGPSFHPKSLVAPGLRIFISLLILIGTALLIIYRPLEGKDGKQHEQEDEIRLEDTSEPEEKAETPHEEDRVP
jgi:hypothetical protein